MKGLIRLGLTCTILATLGPLCTAADFGRTSGNFGVSPSGAATYAIPMWTPPGPNGVQPSIALIYNSNAGNGLAGVGWSLSAASSISRCPKTLHQDGGGAPVLLTLSDRFCLDGNRLRLSSGTYGVAGSVYFTELADYSRITAFGSAGNGPQYFVVEARNGLKYEYGNSVDSRQFAGGTTVLHWMLNKVSDRNGNNYVVTYTSAGGTLLPAAIRWTPTSLGAASYRYEAQFTYDTNRIDLDSSFQGAGGFILINRGLLKSIQISSGGVVKRKYVLEHEVSTVTSRSLLKSVKDCADVAGNNCLLPINFTYQTGLAGLTVGAATPPAGSSNLLYQGRYDFNGDGRDDLAYRSGTTWYVALGANNGFSSPYSTGISVSGISIDRFLPNGRDAIATLISGTLRVARWDDSTSSFVIHNTGIATTALGKGADYNGDGLADLVTKHSNGINLQVRTNTSTGSGNPSFSSSLTNTAGLSSWWRYAGIVGSSTGLDYVDLNGDGREDLNVQVLWTSDNPPFEGDNAVVTVLGTSSGFQVPATSQWVFNAPGEAPSLHFNGDACTDRFVNNTVQLAPCADAWGSTISAPATPKLLLDWDGDGKTDILADIGGTFGVYRSTGNGFSALITTSIPSSGTFFDADLDGDGLDDLVKLNGTSAISYWTHTAGGIAPAYATNIPDLLATATDGFGVAASPNYVSTAWSNYDKGAVTNYPIQEAGPQIVVARAASSDGIGGMFNRDFFYVGSRIHAGRRASVGFQRFDATDARNGLISRSYFEQTFPLSGLLSQTELMQPNGTTAISRTVFSNNSVLLDSTTNNQRHFAFTTGSTATRYEAAGTWTGTLLGTVTTTNLFDNASGTLYDQTVTTTEPAGANGITAGGIWTSRVYTPLVDLLNEPATWCLGRPKRTEVTRSHNLAYSDPTTRTTTTSWNATLCRPTQIVDEPNSALQVTTDLGFDGFGNVTSTTVTGANMAPRSTSAVYANASFTTGLFPLSVTNALGQKTDLAWNYDLAVPTGETDPNGISTSWQYDAFGRRTRETYPDTTYTEWKIFDCAAFSVCSPTVKTFTQWTLRDSGGARVGGDHIAMLDEFDRPTQRLEPTFGNATNFSNIVQIEYDALGRVSRDSIPRMSQSSQTFWNTYVYDLANRPTSIARPISQEISAPQSTTISYAGLSTQVTDPQGKLRTQVVDAIGELRLIRDHDLYSQTFDRDAFGNVKRVFDSVSGISNPLQTSSYNLRGMLTARTDMDMGPWTFTPNALGETVSQTDANGHVTDFMFDALGRLTSRDEDEGVSTWDWGELSDNTPTNKYIGRLKSVSGPGYSESYTFDAIGRLARTTISADGTYDIDYAYNAKGQLHSIAYPTSTSGCRFTVQYGYSFEFLKSVTNVSNSAQCQSTGEVYWMANEGNGFGQIIRETLGNNLNTNRGFDLVTGWLESIRTGVSDGTGVQNLSYEWDLAGNLKKRIDGNQGNLTEEFFYDNLYRLDYSKLGSFENLNLAYDLLGNITSKSDFGNYSYHASKKHQVTSAGSISMAYDLNGNMTSRGTTSISWTSYNYPLCITKGADCTASTAQYSKFSYTPDRQYWKQVARFAPDKTATTLYIGGILEKVTTSAGTDFRHYIPAGGTTVVVSRQDNGTNRVFYVNSDHLGSNVVFNGTTPATVYTSFDAFGRRRGANWTGTPTGDEMTKIAGVTRQGYTGQTMLDNLELIHMNGRVQDPILGRFLSADPFIPDPGSTQSYNRYSYVRNNPLSFVDPSGFTEIGLPNITRGPGITIGGGSGGDGYHIDCRGNGNACQSIYRQMVDDDIRRAMATAGAFEAARQYQSSVLNLVKELSGWNWWHTERFKAPLPSYDCANFGGMVGRCWSIGVTDPHISVTNGDLIVGAATVALLFVQPELGIGAIPARTAPSLAKAASGALRFGAEDLVYGPSAGGALRQLQQSAGGKLLTDIGGPTAGQSWTQFSIQTMERQLAAGGRIRFDLTHMDDIAGAIRGTGQYGNTITAQELRFLQENWSQYKGITTFYQNGVEVVAPW